MMIGYIAGLVEVVHVKFPKNAPGLRSPRLAIRRGTLLKACGLVSVERMPEA